MKSTPRIMKLCQETGGATLSEMAKVFHVGHYSAVSQAFGRIELS